MLAFLLSLLLAAAVCAVEVLPVEPCGANAAGPRRAATNAAHSTTYDAGWSWNSILVPPGITMTALPLLAARGLPLGVPWGGQSGQGCDGSKPVAGIVGQNSVLWCVAWRRCM